jgi:hypothetical protein
MPEQTNHEIEKLTDSIERLTITVDRLELMLRGNGTDPEKSVLGRLASVEGKVGAIMWIASSAMIAALGAIAMKLLR